MQGDRRKGVEMLYLKRLFISIITVSGLLMLNSFAYSADDEIESLRGLKGFYVQALELSANLEGVGLTREQIQTDVELKLRLAGIKVVSKEEMFKIPGFPSLYIIVAAAGTETFGLAVRLELKQVATLNRNSKIEVYPVTWSKWIIGIGSKNHVTSIRDQVKNLTDSFINNYLSVNPKGGN